MNIKKETKGIQYFGMEMKEVEIKGEVVKIRGYASTPDIDRYNDIVEPKAFKSSIEGYMKNPIVLLQHDSDKPIGKVVEYKIGKKGLWIECEITNNLDNVFQNITDGLLRTFSIGFIPKKWRYEEKDGMEVRVIEDLDLIENSVVTTPANGQALFSLSKSIKSFFDNLKDNQETMESKEVEAVKEEIVEEGTNPEVLEEVESEGERPSEEEPKTEEVATETVEEETNDQTKEEEKSFMDIKAMKEELEEVKASVSDIKNTNKELVEALEISVKTITELKGLVAKIPMRKGLASLGGEKEMSNLGKKLFQAKNNIT